jgi:acetyl esterase/lipase
MLHRILALLSVLALFAAVAPSSPQSEKDFIQYTPSPRVRVVPALPFARYGDRTLFLDLYLPAHPSRQPIPGAIVIRGGGWMVGDRHRFAHVASALAERGIAATSIEYRTADVAAFPGAIQDVKAAVRWMRANAAQYGIDPHAIGAIGGSSGAHMALLVGLSAGVAEFEGAGGHDDTSSVVQAVVAMATPADLLALGKDNTSAVAKFLHATPEEDRAKWQFASPVNHITSKGPRVLLLQGASDDSVPVSQSVDFARHYRAAGNTAEVRILPAAPHAFWNYRPWFQEAMDRAATFLARSANP